MPADRKVRVRRIDTKWQVQFLIPDFSSWLTYLGLQFDSQEDALVFAQKWKRFDLVPTDLNGEVWPNLEPQPAHCNHLGNNSEPDSSRKGLHTAHAWHDWAINQNNEYWCDGSESEPS